MNADQLFSYGRDPEFNALCSAFVNRSLRL
jgi:hypothetical protein